MHCITRKRVTYAFLAVLAILALASAMGAPIVAPDAWAGLAAAGALPVALTGEVGGDIRKAIDQLTDTAKAAKETVEQVRKAHTELDGKVSKLHDEMKSGMVDATTKAAFQDAVQKVDKVEKALEKVNDEVAEIAK